MYNKFLAKINFSDNYSVIFQIGSLIDTTKNITNTIQGRFWVVRSNQKILEVMINENLQEKLNNLILETVMEEKELK